MLTAALTLAGSSMLRVVILIIPLAKAVLPESRSARRPSLPSRQMTGLVLISRRRTYMVGGALFAVPVVMIFAKEGRYGLITNAEQLGVLFGALCAGVRGLRKWRDVRPAEAKGHVAGGGDA